MSKRRGTAHRARRPCPTSSPQLVPGHLCGSSDLQPSRGRARVYVRVPSESGAGPRSAGAPGAGLARDPWGVDSGESSWGSDGHHLATGEAPREQPGRAPRPSATAQGPLSTALLGERRPGRLPSALLLRRGRRGIHSQPVITATSARPTTQIDAPPPLQANAALAPGRVPRHRDIPHDSPRNAKYPGDGPGYPTVANVEISNGESLTGTSTYARQHTRQERNRESTHRHRLAPGCRETKGHPE